MRHRKHLHHLAVLAFFLTISYSLALQFDLSNRQNLGTLGTRVIGQYCLATLLMLIAWWSAPEKPSWRDFQFMIIVAVTTRVVLLLVDPYTSNDVSRYLFDGRVALEGLDPYRVAHDAAELVALRDLWMPPAEHAKYPTLYPPLALALFSIAASGGADNALLIWSLMTTFASLAVLLVGYSVLRHEGRLRHFPLLALSPLLILEAGEGLHVDVFTALLVLIAVRYWQQGRLVALGMAIGVGTLLKMLPILLLLPMFVLLNELRQRFALVFTALVTVGGGYLIALVLGLRPVGSLAVFFVKWRSGSPFFFWFEPYMTGFTMLLLVIALISISFAVLTFFLAHSKHKQRHGVSSLDGFWAMQMMLIIPLVLSPVIFPWYLLPLAVLMPLRPSVFVVAWMVCLPFIYEVLNQFVCCKVWLPASWPIHTIGAVLIIAAIIDCILALRPRFKSRRLMQFAGV